MIGKIFPGNKRSTKQGGNKDRRTIAALSDRGLRIENQENRFAGGTPGGRTGRDNPDTPGRPFCGAGRPSRQIAAKGVGGAGGGQLRGGGWRGDANVVACVRKRSIFTAQWFYGKGVAES